MAEAESTSPAWGTPHAGTPAVRTHAPPPAISHRSTSQLDLENPSWRLLGPELRQNHVNATVSPIRCQAGGCPGTLASHRRGWQDCSLHHPQPAFHAPQRQGATLRGMLKPELGTEDLGDLGGGAGGAGCTNSTPHIPLGTYRLPGQERQAVEPLRQGSSLEPLRQADAYSGN